MKTILRVGHTPIDVSGWPARSVAALKALIAGEAEFVSRVALIESVWGDGRDDATRRSSVRAAIKDLRRRLARRPVRIDTSHRHGYRLVETSAIRTALLDRPRIAPARNAWTAEQDDVLLLHGATLPFAELLRLVAEAGQPRTHGAIRQRLNRLGLTRLRGINPDEQHCAWSAAEDEALRSLAGRFRTTEIATQLSARFFTARTPTSVAQRASLLRVSLRRPTLSQRFVSKLFGVHFTAIQRQWVETGLLPAEFDAASTIWQFKASDIEAFIRAYPWEYDWRSIGPGRYRQIAEAVARRAPWLDAPQVARLLGMPKPTLYYWLSAGEVDGARKGLGAGANGRVWRIPGSAIPVLRLRLATPWTERRKARKERIA